MERVFSEKKYSVVIINALAKVGDSPNPHAVGQDNLIKWSKKDGCGSISFLLAQLVQDQSKVSLFQILSGQCGKTYFKKKVRLKPH